LARDRSAETEDLTSKHPVQETDRVASLVVSRDCNIDESQRRVGIAESDDWDVHVRRLTNRLVVGARIGEDQQTRLHVLLLDLVSENTRSEAASNVLGTSVLGVLEHGPLAIWPSRDHTNISRVLDGDDHTGCKHELLPGLGEVDHIHTVRATLESVLLHLEVDVLGSQVNLASQHFFGYHPRCTAG